MSGTHYIKQNDTRDAVRAQLLDANEEIVDLTDAESVSFQMGRKGKTKVDGEGEIVNETEGRVKYEWQDGDTDTADVFKGEFRVEYLDGTVQTFPNNDWIKVVVTEDI